ncbi:MAG: DNA polymerase IV [Clostridia bacterium]|nr:DNA polymerase IV [Clostridia bacterium]
MMRTILHVDLNNCFASIESIFHPEYKQIPFAVGGDEEMRHGIILAKNDIAKKFGIKTGEPLVSARQKCPELKVVKPHYELYDYYCSAVRRMYTDYTDQVEPFGMDECWLDTTGSASLFGNGLKIAQEIRRRVKREFSLTVSVGVSYNKVFAKLGSDYKKPDAVTLITPDNYREIVWNLPVEDLLFVGRATKAKLNRAGIRTIGQLANTSENFLVSMFGKNGRMLYSYANGFDESPVRRLTEAETIKSIGNSTTTPRDMKNEADVNLIFNLLSEQVCKRLRNHNLKGSVVQIHLRSSDLVSFERQMKLPKPTDVSGEVCSAAMELLRANYNFSQPLRSVGVRVCDLSDADAPRQLSLFAEENDEKQRKIEQTKDAINNKYGNYSICRAVIMSDKTLMPEYDPASVTSSFLRR